MQMARLLAASVAVMALALLATGCGDSPADTTTTVATDATTSSVVFGRGSVPGAVPDSFPIPDEANIGATLVDTNRGLTEMILTFPAAVESVATYYEENLPARGYEVTSSGGTDGEWVLEFNGEGIDGVILITPGGSGVSAATVRLTDS